MIKEGKEVRKTKAQEAKYYADKRILETKGHSLLDNRSTAIAIGISRNNFDKIYKELRGTDYQTEEDNKLMNEYKAFTLRGQAENFHEVQPFFYDRSGMFWLWNRELEYYERLQRDEELLNLIYDHTGMDTTVTKNKAELLNALKQVGISKIPKEPPKTWIQFKNGIVDVSDFREEIILPSPKYFITNPLPWELHEETNCPYFDNLFEEWVGKEYVQTLYEIIAYCMLPDYPIQRMFCFVGEGLNGKSCFLNIIREFLGNHNVCATDLDRLLTSRFEVSRLYKKLACFISETNFGEMKQTSMLKQLTGNDYMAFEYKGKDNFEAVNYAKIIISTNSLPETNDKTIGFYRRWLLIDFPNKFTEKKDVLGMIPAEEYDRLASKIITVLADLIRKREFFNEGSLEARQKKYEGLSNPLDKFLKEFTEEDYDSYIWKNDFERKFSAWCKENRLREMSEVVIGKKMKARGIQQDLKHAEWMREGTSQRGRVWVGLRWKE